MAKLTKRSTKLATGGKTLLEQHAEFIARDRANGRRILTLSCPRCAETIETPAAPRGDSWDSLSVCPYCMGMYMKFTTAYTANGLISKDMPL